MPLSFSISDSVTLSIFLLNSIVETIATVLMVKIYRYYPERSRLFICFFFLSSAVCSFGEILIALYVPNYTKGFLLMDPLIILCGFLIFFTLLIYPIEILRPGWLNWRRALLFLSPWLALSAILLFCPLYIRPLYHICQIATYIHEPGVWLRVFLSIIFIPYGVWLFFAQHNWRNTSAPLIWVHTIVAIILCMTITYFASRGLRIFWANIVHEMLYIVLTLAVLYVEIVVRLNSKQHDNPNDYSYNMTMLTLLDETTLPTDSENEISQRVLLALDQPDIWQNPELTQDDMIRLLHTSKRRLTLAIKQLGYDSYPDMINRRRVTYIQEQLKTDPTQNLQDLFYNAGYRSRTSAWRNFTTITGCSPSDFCKNIT